ncbi:hypothetical protein [Acutalibacter muris]|uniref:hypothetical protein n=1 Tax=Acutalibacter muris TaxID=1796620 RepID=UPI001C3EDB5C|nr:hypothetical protein [Acutalibacter muris]
MENQTTLAGEEKHLSVDEAIRISKIIATAPAARMPMIAQVFSMARVDLDGLEELLENENPHSRSALIDTEQFLSELTQGRERTERGYLFTSEEFNLFCLSRDLQPLLVKKHLYQKGVLEGVTECGKLRYSVSMRMGDGIQRRMVIAPSDEKGGKPHAWTK